MILQLTLLYSCFWKYWLQIELTLYDLRGSQSGTMVSCEESFCSSTYGGDLPGCTSNLPCQYSVLYGDGSSTTGYFVTDVLHYDQVTGDSLTRAANASVTFGYVLFSHYMVYMEAFCTCSCDPENRKTVCPIKYKTGSPHMGTHMFCMRPCMWQNDSVDNSELTKLLTEAGEAELSRIFSFCKAKLGLII